MSPASGDRVCSSLFERKTVAEGFKRPARNSSWKRSRSPSVSSVPGLEYIFFSSYFVTAKQLDRDRSCSDTNRTGDHWLVLHVILTFKMADDLELEALRLEIERKSFELESLKTQLALKVRNGK